MSISAARSSRTLSLPSGSSSTIRALILRFGRFFPDRPCRRALRDRQHCRDPAAGQFRQLERLTRSIQPYPPRLCFRDPDPLPPTFTGRSGVASLDPKTVVEDSQLERPVLL